MNYKDDEVKRVDDQHSQPTYEQPRHTREQPTYKQPKLEQPTQV